MNYPNIDPVAFSFGPVQVHWYGLMYLFALGSGWFLARLRVKKKMWAKQGWNINQIDDLVTYTMLGVIAGGRLGYILFYDFKNYLADPLEILRIWNGGMSFHGGLVGVLVAIYYFSRRYRHTFLEVLDFIAPLVPPGLFFGRIGNFINAELWGKITQNWLGIVFPRAGHLPRHPSQLYEAILEGLVLFLILWIYSSKPRPSGKVAGLFAIGYGVFRFGVEFVREPDSHLGYLAFGWLTMGQVLCLPLIFVGIWLFFLNQHKHVA